LKRKMSHYLEYLGMRAVSLAMRFFSIRGIERLGSCFGWFAYRFVPIRKSLAREQIMRAFPELNSRAVERILKESYISLCRSFFEVFKLPTIGRDALLALVEVDGREHIDRALENGRGLVAVTYHLGNWELMGTITALLGYPLDVIVQRQSNPLSDALINDMREKVGMRVIGRRNAVSGSLNSLRENRMVGFLSDQDAHEGGVFAPLFGRPASTPKGAAVMALRCRAPIVTTVILRNSDGTHRYMIRPLEVRTTGDLQEDVRAIVCGFTSRLEEYVRQEPGQWLWQHRRWKTRPAERTCRSAPAEVNTDGPGNSGPGDRGPRDKGPGN